jgi:hypothetical protein
MRFSALLVLSASVALAQQVFDLEKQEPKNLSVCDQMKFCKDFMTTIHEKLNFN